MVFFFPLASCFRAPSWVFAPASLPHWSLVELVLASRRGPSHLTLLPQYLEWSPPVLQLSQSPCVYLIGLAELRCYHRAVVKLTPEFPGTGTSKFSPSCSRTTFIYKLDLRRFKATTYFFGDSKPRHIPRRFKATDCSTAIQSHVIFLRRFKATSYFFGDSKPTCLRRLKATQHFTPGDSPTCFEFFYLCRGSSAPLRRASHPPSVSSRCLFETPFSFQPH